MLGTCVLGYTGYRYVRVHTAGYMYVREHRVHICTVQTAGYMRVNTGKKNHTKMNLLGTFCSIQHH